MVEFMAGPLLLVTLLYTTAYIGFSLVRAGAGIW